VRQLIELHQKLAKNIKNIIANMIATGITLDSTSFDTLLTATNVLDAMPSNDVPL
jgi:hypothetical protein